MSTILKEGFSSRDLQCPLGVKCPSTLTEGQASRGVCVSFTLQKYANEFSNFIYVCMTSEVLGHSLLSFLLQFLIGLMIL